MINGVSWVGSLGYDYRQVVSAIIQAQSGPVTLMQQRQARLDAQKTAWMDIRTRLQTLQSRLNDLMLDSTFQSKKATSTNSAVVTATASAAAVNGSYNIDVTQLAQAHVIASDPQASATAALNLTGSFTINGKVVNVAATDSLTNIRDSINAVGAGITASVVGTQLVLKATATGTANAITVNADPNNILGSIGVVNSGTTTIKNQVQAAQDAIFSVDGLSVTRPSNTVTDVIAGVTLTLSGRGTGVTLTVANDPQKALDTINAFVDQYNSTLDFIRLKLGKPDANGNNGELQGDPTLARLEQTLRRDISTVVNGLTSAYKDLASIGITTQGQFNGGSLSTAETGRLVVDTAKLTAALTADPQAVKDLLFSASPTINSVGRVLNNDISMYVAGTNAVIPGQEAMLAKRRDDLAVQIQRFKDLMAMREQTMINRFIAAEKMVSLLQQQGGTLMARYGLAGTQG